MTESLYFADCCTKELGMNPFFLKTAAMHQQADVMDGIRHALQVHSEGLGRIVDSAWEALIYDDPSVKGGHYANLPTTVFLPDLGISIVAIPGRTRRGGDVQVRADGRLQSQLLAPEPPRIPTAACRT